MKHDKRELSEAVNKNLEQIFQAYLSDEPAPDSVKREVFQTIETITLAANIIDLFTGQFIQAKGAFLDDLTIEPT